jgi:hypothetical protein
MKIKAEDVNVGTRLKTWFGTHTIVCIRSPYKETNGFLLNVLIFLNGMEMSNRKYTVYEGEHFGTSSCDL